MLVATSGVAVRVCAGRGQRVAAALARHRTLTSTSSAQPPLPPLHTTASTTSAPVDGDGSSTPTSRITTCLSSSSSLPWGIDCAPGMQALIMPSCEQRRGLASFYDQRYRRYALRPLMKITISDLIDFEKKHGADREALLLKSAEFLRTAIPVRIAKRIHDIYTLPYICGCNPHIQHMLSTYTGLFDQLEALPPIKSPQDEKLLVELLEENLAKTRPLLPRLAKASHELAPYIDKAKLTEFVSTMIKGRIARRMLAEQHIRLHQEYYNPKQAKRGEDVGTISISLDVAQVARVVYSDVAEICRNSYGVAPKLHIVQKKAHTYVPYIKSHLEYMFLELFKNAARATTENFLKKKNSTAPGAEVPAITLSIFPSPDTTTFCIADQGGGIRPEIEKEIWEFAFTTIGDESAADQTGTGIGQALTTRPMAGEGFGLPMTKIYAQYFGGDLTSENIHSHGAQFFLRLKHLNRQEYMKDIAKQDEQEETEERAQSEVMHRSDTTTTTTSSSSIHGRQ